MLAENVACAVFVIAVFQAPSLAPMIAILAIPVYAALDATIAEFRKLSTREAELRLANAQKRALTEENEKMREKLAKSETALAQLQKRLSTLEVQFRSSKAQNRDLKVENKGMQKEQTASKATIAKLQAQSTRLEAELQTTCARNNVLMEEKTERLSRIAADADTREALSREIDQGKMSALSLQQRLEEKTKEAKDWKDLHLRSSTNPSHRQAIQRGDTSSITVAGIMDEKDHIIKQLNDRLSECHSLLRATSTLNPQAPEL
ncbi:hypothetical protein MD484_g8694, partial [Candolleomyces efflorescens]